MITYVFYCFHCSYNRKCITNCSPQNAHDGWYPRYRKYVMKWWRHYLFCSQPENLDFYLKKLFHQLSSWSFKLIFFCMQTFYRHTVFYFIVSTSSLHKIHVSVRFICVFLRYVPTDMFLRIKRYWNYCKEEYLVNLKISHENCFPQNSEYNRHLYSLS